MSTNWRLFTTITEMEFRQFWRDFVSAFFNLFFPLIFLILFGASGSRPPAMTVGMAFVAPSPTPRSHALAARLRANPAVRLTTSTYEGALKSMREASIGAAVVVPADENAPIRLIATEAQLPIARTTLDAARAPVLTAGAPPADLLFAYVLEPPPTPVVSQFSYIFPGLLAMSLLQLGLFATANPLLRARESGALRHISTTPIPKGYLIGAQLLVRFSVAMVQLLIMLTAGLSLGIVINGDWKLLLTALMLGTSMSIALGYALVGWVPRAQLGMGIIMFTNFLMLGLGQVFFDVGKTSTLSQVSRLMPLTYVSDAYRQIILGITGSLPLWFDMTAMAFWGLLGFLVALRTFRFQM